MLLSLAGWWLVQESRTSAMQARIFAGMAAKVSYKLQPGPSNNIRFPSDSPYDERLGYANMPGYLAKLKARDFEIVAQARLSPKMVELADMGLFATYREKTRVGLAIHDFRKAPLFAARYRNASTSVSTMRLRCWSRACSSSRTANCSTRPTRSATRRSSGTASARRCSTSRCTCLPAPTSARPAAARWRPRSKSTAIRRTGAPVRCRTS
jgi:hypothetical protein